MAVPLASDPSLPDRERISLTIPSAGLEVKNWLQYEYAADLDSPADAWSFSIPLEGLEPDVQDNLFPGQEVQLMLNGSIHGTGFVDSIEIAVTRSSGVVWTIRGRDKIGQAVDACADPTKVYAESATLLDVIKDQFAPFGWSNDEDFINTNDANRNARANLRGVPRYRSKSRKVLKSYRVHQLKPFMREGVYQFCARIAKRNGLMIWQTHDGSQLVLSAPEFDSEPLYLLFRNRSGTSNVLDGSVKYDLTNQPTCIVADGSSMGGEFGRGKIKSIMANTAIRTFEDYSDDFKEPWARFPDAKRIPGYNFPTNAMLMAPRPRPVYLHDENSTTQEQLDNFVRREMAQYQRSSLTVNYVVEGHGQITDKGFVPWIIDTTVDVDDEIAGLRERFYIIGRTFHRSRSGGTTTSLKLIRLHTYQLEESENDRPPPKVPTDESVIREARAVEDANEAETNNE